VTPRRSLVTGATGFLGRALCRHLNGPVLATVHPGGRLPDGLATVTIDAQLSEPLAQFAPEVCFHIAGAASTRDDLAVIDDLIDANIAAGTKVLAALADRAIPIVMVGTIWQHAHNHPYRPATLYAAMKQAQLDIARYFADLGAAIVNVEIGDTYGPDDDRAKLIPALVSAAATGQPLELTPGEQLTDLLHVDDVAAGLLLAADLAIAGELQSYSVRSDRAITIRELVATASLAWDCDVPVRFGTRNYRRTEMFTPWHVAPPLPGFSPTIDLERGLHQLAPIRNGR
jgi:CDP-3, 6-dideoxy-D-glycero-L-glycero-4-hexulose-4-reductase